MKPPQWTIIPPSPGGITSVGKPSRTASHGASRLVAGGARDPQIQKYLTSIGSNGVYYTRRSSNVELALDLPSLKVKDTAVGTALHEFAESYFPQYLAYR